MDPEQRNRRQGEGMIIITGAAGLIGSAIARELNRRGRDDLILVDHLGTTEKWMHLRSVRYRDYYEKDVFLEMVQKANREGSRATNLEKIDTIIHMGANSSTMEKDASHLVQNNYHYSVELAHFALRFQVRMVYASSAATYGDGSLGFDDDLSGLDSLRPLNMYGYSKQMFDQWLRNEGFPSLFAGLKYFNVYGPNEYHKGDMMSLVLKAYRQVLNDGKIRLFKSYHPDYRDGEQMRDFFYVEDAAKMTVYLALDQREVSGVFNAGSGKAETWVELATSIFHAMGRDPQIEFIEMPDILKGKYQYYTCAPIDRIRNAGFTAPIRSVRDGVSDYVKNYLEQGELRA